MKKIIIPIICIVLLISLFFFNGGNRKKNNNDLMKIKVADAHITTWRLYYLFDLRLFELIML